MKDAYLKDFEIVKDTVQTMHALSVSYTVTGNWVVEIDNIIRLPGEEVIKSIAGRNLYYDMKIRFIEPLASTIDGEGAYIETDPRLKEGKFVHVEYAKPDIDKP